MTDPRTGKDLRNAPGTRLTNHKQDAGLPQVGRVFNSATNKWQEPATSDRAAIASNLMGSSSSSGGSSSSGDDQSSSGGGSSRPRLGPGGDPLNLKKKELLGD